MDSTPANPVIIVLMFLARCLVPLLIMLGISYLLKRLGLIQEPPQPPEEETTQNNHGEGDLVHGKM
jgi:hypothetical protein